MLIARPEGGPLALAILGLLGVQAALFGPAKYGIIPELVPTNGCRPANGVLEMGSNLAILSGMVAGAVILQAARDVGCRRAIGAAIGGSAIVVVPDPTRPLWTGGLLLTAFSVCGLLAALTIPRVPPARAEGGLAATVRIAWEAIRADRVLQLTIIGQVLVWAIASLVPAPILPYASKILGLSDLPAVLPLVALGLGIGAGCVLAGRLSGAKVEYGLLPLGALGLTLCTLAFAAIGPRLPGLIADHDADGDLQRAAVRPAQCPAPGAVAGRPPRRGHRVLQHAGLRRHARRARCWPWSWPGRGPAAGHVPGRSRSSCWPASSGR